MPGEPAPKLQHLIFCTSGQTQHPAFQMYHGCPRVSQNRWLMSNPDTGRGKTVCIYLFLIFLRLLQNRSVWPFSLEAKRMSCHALLLLYDLSLWREADGVPVNSTYCCPTRVRQEEYTVCHLLTQLLLPVAGGRSSQLSMPFYVTNWQRQCKLLKERHPKYPDQSQGFKANRSRSICVM